jgi:hypothetical protein
MSAQVRKCVSCRKNSCFIRASSNCFSIMERYGKFVAHSGKPDKQVTASCDAFKQLKSAENAELVACNAELVACTVCCRSEQTSVERCRELCLAYTACRNKMTLTPRDDPQNDLLLVG